MADFSDIKGTVLTTLGVVAEKTKDLAGKAADKAKDMTKYAKLSMELSTARDTLQKTYAEIGKLYYDTRKADPDNFFVQLCEEVKLGIDNIARLQVEIDELKAGVGSEADMEVEFTETAAEDDFVKEDAPAEEPKAETPAE